ncbi:glycosyltransferase family 2 protein [Bacillus sp. ISL-55]|uniref:glycosyltransferase family 2 protein n=1 Tax=Bacillus sp. ISL-55 TaxID=2819134 RepID=UPI001BE6F65E|nr:glycosyltransferase family 2 protein [Bacillus sp. ISL-55]
MATHFDKDLVSVIIPIYNSDRYISKTLDSVLNQDYKFLEIVLVDDCSTDDSELIINNYKKNNQNIVYHRLERNSGAAVARNKALELASGRYIAFLDSDDLWDKSKMRIQLELMKKTKAPICYTAIEMINENDILIKGKRDVKEILDYKFLLKNTMMATSSIVIDRDITGDFRMPLIRSGQDYATWLQLLRDGKEAYGVNEALVKYRVSNSSLSSNKWKSIKQVWSIQTYQEKLNPFFATFNTLFFIFNALKKHYF